MLQLLHSVVDSVEKRLSGSGGTLTLKCKDFVHLYLDLPSAEDCLNVAASVEQLSNIGKGLTWDFVRCLLACSWRLSQCGYSSTTQGFQFSLFQGGTLTPSLTFFGGYFHPLFINLEGIT